ncbi:MAG: alpha/beta hydrolase [Clostridia bacterium]|nr:alpha/beta hydrolase [Clostridia bacterium]
MKKNKKNFLLGTGIALGSIAAISSISYLITKKMVTIALDRQVPDANPAAMKLLTGDANIEEKLNFLTENSKALEDKGLEVVEITAQDGTVLVGHLYKNKKAKRTIIAMHGWRSSWARDFCLVYEFLFESDCNVLFVEQRGQGDSGGDYMGFGLMERYDCLDWINWVNSTDMKKLPVYLMGISMGATTVLMTTGFDLPQNVKGVIADCGFTSPNDIWRHIAQNMKLLYTSFMGEIASAICRRKINVAPDGYSTVTALENSQVPVLFIHGTEDKFVPIEMTYENYKACVAPKSLFIVPGAEHGTSYFVAKDEYENQLKQFWSKWD